MVNLVALAQSTVQKSISYTMGGQYTYFVSLVLPADALPAATSFTFQLQCSTGMATSTSSIVISTNDPPNLGSYIVKPTAGTMLSTVFDFLAVRWEDSDRPITYEFAYESMSGGKYLVHRGRKEVASASSDLPQGVAQQEFRLRTRLQVFDALDGKAVEYSSVTVQQIDFSVRNTEQYLHTVLAASSDYVGGMKDAMAKALIMVNAVSCEFAPNCSALHRTHCRDRAHTCGQCLANFVGEASHANTKCIPLGTGQTRRLALMEASVSTAKSSATVCIADEDCSSAWHGCVNGVCALESKRCRDSCSGRGHCEFVSRYDTNVTFSTCSVLDEDCLARCVCHADYAGQLCEHTAGDFNTSRRVRHTLVQTLHVLADMEVIAADTLLSWLQSLASVSSDAGGLDSYTRALVTDLALRFLVEGAALGMSYENFSAVGDILDLVLLEEGSDDAAIQLSAMYNKLILDNIVTGQHQVDITGDMFRASFFAANALNGTVVGVTPVNGPKSFEAVPQSVKLQGTSLITAVSVSETLGNSSAYYSNPLGVTFNGQLPCNTSASSHCTIDITLTVKPDRRRLYPLQDTKVHEMRCVDSVNPSHTFHCGDGSRIALHCNGTRGVVSKRCPLRQHVPTCASLSPSGGPCYTLTVANNTVTCRCVIFDGSGGTGRRLQVPGSGADIEDDYSYNSQISMDYAVVMRSIVTDFTETWSSASSLGANSVTENIQVLITVGALGVLGALAVLGSVRLD